MSTLARVWQVSGKLRQFVLTLARDVRSIPNIWPTILLGGLLWGYAVWLVVPSFFVLGFFVRMLRYIPPSATGVDITPRPSDPPRFDRWTMLLFDGVRAYVIWTAYILIAFAGYLSVFELDSSSALFLSILSSLLGNLSFLLQLYTTLNAEAAAPSEATVGVLVDPALLGLLFAMYVGPAALLNFSARGRLSDGFSFSDLRPILRNLNYARNWVVFITTWFLGTLLLFTPSALVAQILVPVDIPTVVEAVEESIELLRGFLSFAIILLGYAALGRVSVPPQDDSSLREYIQSRLDSDAIAFVSRSLRSGKTILIAALLASFWSVPSIVLLMGYVTIFLCNNEPSGDATFPSFGPLGVLIAGGLRAVGLWVVYGLPALVFLFIWNISNPWPDPITGDVLKAMTNPVLTGLPAFVLGSWHFSREVYDLMIEVGLYNIVVGAPIDAQQAIVAFSVLTLLTMYFYPAALVLVARSRNLRSGLSPRRLADSAGTLVYAAAWLRAIALLILGSALLLAWNYWRTLPGRKSLQDTTSLFLVGDFSLITFPNEIGIQSSLFLFLVGTGNVLLLFRAYYGIAMAIPNSRKTETRES